MEVRWVLLVTLVLLASQIQPVSCPIEHAPSPCVNVVPVPDLKDSCGNSTILCTRISSFEDRLVPWLSCFLSFFIFFVPGLRVKRLQPNDRGEADTLFWWFLFLGFLDYIFWVCYLNACRHTYYSAFPVFLSCMIGLVIHAVLLLVATLKTSIAGDQRIPCVLLLSFLVTIFGVVCADKHIVGWLGVALSVLSHSCRIGSTDYYANFDMLLFGASITGSTNGFLWLFHPQLCISMEYKNYVLASLMVTGGSNSMVY